MESHQWNTESVQIKPQLQLFCLNASFVVCHGEKCMQLPHRVGGHDWHSHMFIKGRLHLINWVDALSVTKSINKGQNQLGNNSSGSHKSF